MVCLSLWGGICQALAQGGDEFNPPNPVEPAAIDYCWLTVSADPAEGAYVSGGGKYTVNGNSVYVSTSARNTSDYTYTFLYWTLNGEKTSYSQSFWFTPQKGRYELVAHYEKNEVIFDPNNPQEPSSTDVKRRYYLYLTSSIEGAGSFNIASGNKHEEKSSIYVNFYLNPGYQFDGWKLNGTIVSTSTGFYLNMPSANSILEACITEVPFDPESPMDPSGSGSGVDVSGRQIVDLAIGNADNVIDKTRVIFHEEKTLGYDTGSDAAKFISDDAAYQIYSLDSEGTMYSINQRPADNGEVPLGIIVKNAGDVTISANRIERSVAIYDKLLDVYQDLSVNGYTFNATPGTIEDRFVLMTDLEIITANSYTIKYGDKLPTFGYTSGGVTVEGTPSITCAATETSPIGEYVIVISKGTVTNNNIIFANGKLTISKAPLKITARDYTIKQGEPLPVFEADYDGFKNDETEEVMKKSPVIATVATSASKPGEYDITVSGAEAQNYEISYGNGKLTILPYLRGDANGDGKVDMDDATFVTNIILGTEVATEAADVNNDGTVNMPDAMFIVNKILNGKFPDE